MKNKLLAVALIAFAGTGYTAARQESPNSAADALSLMRRINGAQAEASIARRPYASLETLLQHRELQGVRGRLSPTDGVSAKFRGGKLTVIASADGSRYQARLVPEAGCGVAYFSDESGVIYTGNALGCEGDSR